MHDGVVEVQNNLTRKKLQRVDEGSNFVGGSFRNRDIVRAPIHFRRESQPQHLKMTIPQNKAHPFSHQ